jgi:uncharacterized protein with von Willebrand factor type A (vWA) domain
MFFNFIDELRAAGIKASFKEHLTLLEALDKDVIDQTPEAFYYLSRATFVKDEGLLDRFDQVFNKVFKGLLTDYGQKPVDVPEDWLKAVAEKFLSPEEMEAIKALGSWDEIRAATSGSAPAAQALTAIRATTPKACASAARASTSAR